MSRSFTLKVTEAVIVEATREDSAHCMIAVAVYQAGGRYPTITKETVSFNYHGTRYTYPLPAKAALELVRFDEGEKIVPFVVQLAGNSAAVRPVRQRSHSRKKQNGTLLKGARRKPRHNGHRRIHRGHRRANGLRVLEVKNA